jgi:hypothetical protein
MRESVTGIELVAFAVLVVAALGFIGMLFAVFLAGERPRNGPADSGVQEALASGETGPSRARDAGAET